MKQGWELKKLGEVCNVGYGTRVVNKRDGGSIYPVYGGGGPTFFMDTFNRADCLVVGRFALSEKCTRFVKGQFFLNDSGLTVSPLNKNELFQNFLNLQLLFLNDYIYSLAKGAAQKNLDVSAFKNIEIHYPKSLPEQERIVSILDQVFSAIEQAKANAEKNLKNAKELFDSYLNGVFTNKGEDWEDKKLGAVAEYFNGLTYSPKNVSDNGIIVLRSSNIQNDKLDFSDIVYVNVSVKDKLKVRKNDILMCSRNGSKRLVGKTAKIGDLKKEMTFGTFMMIVRSDYHHFLSWFFKSYNFKSQISQGENTMINQITRYMLDDIVISMPSIETQLEISNYLNKLLYHTKQLEVIYQQKIIELEKLKKSILQKAFNGELI